MALPEGLMKDTDGPAHQKMLLTLRSNGPREAHSRALKTHTVLNIMILILKWSPRSPCSASWIRETPNFSSITPYLGKWYHHPSCCASSESRGHPDPPSPFPSSHLPLSCPFLKDSLLFPPPSVLITIIPQQNCFGSTVSGQLTFDPALSPTWSMYNGLSELLKMIISKPPSPTPSLPSF